MKKFKITQQDYLKAHRKADREAEIERHGKSAHLRRTVHRSKKTSDRTREKAGIRKILPFSLLRLTVIEDALYCGPHVIRQGLLRKFLARFPQVVEFFA